MLSGFGDLNVDKGEDGNKSAGGGAAGRAGATAMISSQEMERIKALPVREIKGMIRALGTDPDKYPEICEKGDLIKLYRSKAIEAAVVKHDANNAADAAKAKTPQEIRAQRKREAKERARFLCRARKEGASAAEK